jgi:hypothetical protein
MRISLGEVFASVMALGLLALWAAEWRRFRQSRLSAPRAYPTVRIVRRTASLLALEGVLALICLAERFDVWFGRGMGQAAALGLALALALTTLLLALGDLREMRGSVLKETETAVAGALEEMRRRATRTAEDGSEDNPA